VFSMANVRGNVQRLPNLVFKLLTAVPHNRGAMQNVAGEARKVGKLEYEAPMHVSKVTVKQYFQQIYGHDIKSVHTQIIPGKLKSNKLKRFEGTRSKPQVTGFQRPWKKVMVYLRTPLSLGAPFSEGALFEATRAYDSQMAKEGLVGGRADTSKPAPARTERVADKHLKRRADPRKARPKAEAGQRRPKLPVLAS